MAISNLRGYAFEDGTCLEARLVYPWRQPIGRRGVSRSAFASLGHADTTSPYDEEAYEMASELTLARAALPGDHRAGAYVRRADRVPNRFRFHG